MLFTTTVLLCFYFFAFMGPICYTKKVRWKGVLIYDCETLSTYSFKCTSLKNGIWYPTHIATHITTGGDITWNMTETRLGMHDFFTIKDNDEYMEHKINIDTEWTHEPTVRYEAMQELRQYLIE
jgi:hypothetical protein